MGTGTSFHGPAAGGPAVGIGPGLPRKAGAVIATPAHLHWGGPRIAEPPLRRMARGTVRRAMQAFGGGGGGLGVQVVDPLPTTAGGLRACGRVTGGVRGCSALLGAVGDGRPSVGPTAAMGHAAKGPHHQVGLCIVQASRGLPSLVGGGGACGGKDG